MNKNTIYLIIGFAICAVQVFSGCQPQPKNPYVQAPENTFTIKGSVREITINPETPEFPQQEGKNLFTSYCSMCHSLKYISMQPDFPRKTWEAEVNKMVVKYKAPIDSETCVKIVDYLVKIKSKK